MPQFARPAADTFNSGWEEDDGTTVAIFDQIDEAVRDDADFIRTVLNPTSAVYVTKLSAVEDPVSGIGHVIDYTFGKNAAGGGRVDQTFELREAYVSEANQGTLIASQSHVDVPAGFNAGSFTLTGLQADSILDYTNLYTRVTTSQIPE